MVHQEGNGELESRVNEQIQKVNETDAPECSAFVAFHVANGRESGGKMDDLKILYIVRKSG